jgi:pimeloyl-ACP methyl ester carboxylesterase
MFSSYKRLDFWDLLESPPQGVDIHIVRAARSDRWSKRELEQLDAVDKSSGGRVRVHVLPDAGHWLHIENPGGLLGLISPSLASAA